MTSIIPNASANAAVPSSLALRTDIGAAVPAVSAVATSQAPVAEAEATAVEVSDAATLGKAGKASGLSLDKGAKSAVAATEFDKKRWKAERGEREERFNGMDANGDGAVSKSEWTEGEVEQEINGREFMNLNAVVQFKEYDKDGDGELTMKEYQQGRKQDTKETAAYNKAHIGDKPDGKLGEGLNIPDGVILGPSTIWDITQK